MFFKNIWNDGCQGYYKNTSLKDNGDGHTIILLQFKKKNYIILISHITVLARFKKNAKLENVGIVAYGGNLTIFC